MNRVLKRSFVLFVVLFAFVGGLVLYYISLAFSGGDWATYPANKHIYSNGILVKAGEITDRDGVVLARENNETATGTPVCLSFYHNRSPSPLS